MNFRLAKKIINFRKLIVKAVQITIGTALLSLAVTLFLLPNHISTGGFSGIATIGYYLLNIPMGMSVMVLNIPLFIVVLIKGGKKELINAIFGTIMLSVFLNIFEKFNVLTEDKLLAGIYGGILAGLGSAIVFKANASTGGTDLLASIVKMFKPNIKRGNMMIVFDAIVITLNVIFFKEIDVALYSAIVIFIMGKIIDAFFEGVNFSRTIYIISPKYEEISAKIGKEMRRGVTLLEGMGMYKKEEKRVIFCVVSRGEVKEIRKIVNGIDGRAFVVISNAREVFGEGFKK